MTEASDLEASLGRDTTRKIGGMKGLGYGGLVGRQAPYQGPSYPPNFTQSHQLYTVSGGPLAGIMGRQRDPLHRPLLFTQSCFRSREWPRWDGGRHSHHSGLPGGTFGP